MKRLGQICLLLLIGLMLWLDTKFDLPAAQAVTGHSPLPAALEVFRSPVVDEAEISSYFDHDDRAEVVTFFDGRTNKPASGFLFTCPPLNDTAPGASTSWVGCGVTAKDESTCPNDQELWYDDHRGTDYEFAADWYTGATCDPARFPNLNPPIYAPAAGVVDFVGVDHPFNGNFILLYHDLNDDGNYYNDGLRSYYLHFVDNGIVVDEGDLVQPGDLLGYGGMTGLAWTPHLHFEVQRRTKSGWLAVDPFGWHSSTADPWLVPNDPLWIGEVSAAIK